MAKEIKLIGIPLDLGAERIGVDMAPNALRYHKILQKLRSVGLKIEDAGNIPCPTLETSKVKNRHMRYVDEIRFTSEKVASIVSKEIKNHKILAIGGDHSVAMGTIAGASKALGDRLGLIWIDAHGDLNTHETTLTGNIHGMPLAAIMGYGHKSLVDIFYTGPKITKERVLIIGVKDLDSGERELINKEDLDVFSVGDLLSYGLNILIKKIQKLCSNTKYVWVSMDLDAVDRQFAPGVGMPNNGGLTYREIAFISDYIGKNCNVIGVDMVEFNPVNDLYNQTSDLCIELIAKFFGKDYSSYSQYLASQTI